MSEKGEVMTQSSKVRNKKYMLVLGIANAVIGLLLILVGIFKLQDPDSIIRSILFVFGETAGRTLCVLFGILVISMSIKLLRVVISGDALNNT